MYTVKLKTRTTQRTLNNVVGDGYIDDRNIRFFALSDGERVEVDMTGAIVTFGKERATMIRESDERH